MIRSPKDHGAGDPRRPETLRARAERCDAAPAPATPAAVSRGERALFTPEEWSTFLSGALQRSVSVRYGRALRQVLTATSAPSELRVRMNAVFGRAPLDVRQAVADWLRSGKRAKRACRRLDEWIADVAGTLGPPRAPRIVTRGRIHDLAEIAADLLQHEFAALPRERRPAITWGRRGSSKIRRSLQLGSFDPDAHLVRVHPALDQPGVPRSFVRYVLFHELLHAELAEPCAERKKRAVHHSAGFRAREAAYRGYDAALAWQERWLTALIRSARSGRPMRAPGGRLASAWRPLQRLLFPD